MVAEDDCCTCAVCGVRCTGLFLGCAEVWARGTNGSTNGHAANGNGNGARVPIAEPVAWGSGAAEVDRFDPLQPGPAAPPIAPLATAADLGIDWDAPSAVTPTTALQPEAYRREPRPRPSWYRSRNGMVAIGVAVALVIGGLYLGTRSSGSGSGGISTPITTTSDLTFDTFDVAPGVSGTRRWQLRGTDGEQFIGKVTFENRTSATTTFSYDETIPKTLARNVSVILFEPPPVVVQPDPVVRYTFDLEPEASVTITYRISVPPKGRDRSRLERWARDVDTEIAQRVEAAREAAANAQNPEELAAAQAALEAALASQASFTPRRSNGGGSGSGGGIYDPGPTNPTADTTPTTPDTTPTTPDTTPTTPDTTPTTPDTTPTTPETVPEPST